MLTDNPSSVTSEDSAPELLLDAQAHIAESPTWSAEGNALYWIDIKEPALHRLDEDGGRRQWRFEDEVGAFALTEGAEGAVAALRSGLVHLAFGTGRVTQLAPPPFDAGRFRFNEGLCDADGRFWLGVMFDPRPGSSAPPDRHRLHRFSFAEGLVPGPSPSSLHNGFAWSRDGDEFFWSHSYEQTVFRADYDQACGVIGEPRPFLTTDDRSVAPGGRAVPDGAAMDEEGCYWCAIHGAGVLHRYSQEGLLLSRIALPVSQPTMCAFTGSDLAEMVVTSAADGLSPEQLRREPHAGGLFRLHPGVRGLRRPCMVR